MNFLTIRLQSDPDEDHEWVNCQLAILFRTSEYLSEIGSRYKRSYLINIKGYPSRFKVYKGKIN